MLNAKVRAFPAGLDQPEAEPAAAFKVGAFSAGLDRSKAKNRGSFKVGALTSRHEAAECVSCRLPATQFLENHTPAKSSPVCSPLHSPPLLISKFFLLSYASLIVLGKSAQHSQPPPPPLPATLSTYSN